MDRLQCFRPNSPCQGLDPRGSLRGPSSESPPYPPVTKGRSPCRNAAPTVGKRSNGYPWIACNVSGQTAHAKGCARGGPELQAGGHVTTSVSGNPPEQRAEAKALTRWDWPHNHIMAIQSICKHEGLLPRQMNFLAVIFCGGDTK